MSFHHMTPGHDEFGIVPSVFAVDKHGKRDRRTFARSADQLQEQAKPLRLEQNTFRQGPLRHPDVVQWMGDGSPFGHFFVVSPRFHAVLGAARLPAHRVFDVVVQWPQKEHRKHGQGDAPYFLYAFDQPGLLDAFDLTATALTCTVRLLTERMNFAVELAPGSVATGAAAWEAAARACPADQRPWVLPTALHGPVDDQFEPIIDFASPHFPIATTDVDLLFLDHSYAPWVSDGLRAALEAMGATGIAFEQSWDETRLRAPNVGARDVAMMAVATDHAGAPVADPAFARLLERRAEILSRNDRVRELVGEPTDVVSQLEVDLDVQLPEVYRACLADNSFPGLGRFRFLPIEELNTLEEIDPDWSAKSAPQAVRALLVAVDDGGDYLGYLLREDSMTQLDDQLMHFHHETAEISTSRVRLKLAPPTEA